MQKLILFLACVGFAFGQTISVVVPQGAAAGATVPYSIVLANGGGPAGVEFTFSGAAGDVPTTPIVAGTAAAAGKSIGCAVVPGTVTPAPPVQTLCLIYSISSSVIGDGTIASGTYTIPLSHGGQSDQFITSATLGATIAGAAVVLAPGPMGTIAVTKSRCDLNGDGIFSATDVTLLLGAAVSVTPNLALYDLNSDGKVDIVDVLIEVIAVLNGTCLAK